MVHFSILVAYRNRSPAVVQLCLQSLAMQTYPHFEVCFLDYGSEPTIQEQVKTITQNFAFVRYFVSQTQGYFWNKSKALNFLTQQAQYEYILIVDIDLVLIPNFLAILANYFPKWNLLSYAIYWLPPECSADSCLTNTQNLSMLSYTYAKGCIAYQRKDLVAVGGYDEFYCIWGVEDLDLIARIEHTTRQNLYYVPIEETHALHVWHPTVASQMPKHWYNFLYHHYFARKKAQNFSNQPNYLAQPIALLTMSNRPILLQREQPNDRQIIDFQFSFPLLRSFSLFYQTFHNLPQGKFLRIKQTFSSLLTQNSSFKVKVFQTLNYFLQKFRISYRFSEIIYYDTELVSATEVRDFLFYFIHSLEGQIQDYYFDFQENTIECWLYKG